MMIWDLTSISSNFTEITSSHLHCDNAPTASERGGGWAHSMKISPKTKYYPPLPSLSMIIEAKEENENKKVRIALGNTNSTS